MNINKYINPFFITGLTDGDGSFWITITRSKTNKVGWSVAPYFSITAGNNSANIDMLNEVNKYWKGIGKVRLKYHKNSEAAELEIIGLSNCLSIRDHFDNYPLLTYKLVNFQLWSKVLNLMEQKQHLNTNGLSEIISIKSQFKMGLSPLLQTSFPNHKEYVKPAYIPDFNKIKRADAIQWLTGFINSDGHFGFFITGEASLKTRCTAQFSLCQLNSSRIVLEYVTQLLGFGTVYPLIPGPLLRNNASTVHITGIKQLNKLIQVLAETKFYGAKALDYADFCKGINIMNNKGHLTNQGLSEMRDIAKSMNTGREFDL